MGGTGTAELALRYADQFAAAAPLCGYHSFFTRRDTKNRRLRSWEIGRMHHWSTSSWVENGRHLPLFVAHGTKDFPLENSKVLIRRYQELGYAVQQEWPDTGHSVWKVSYRGARLWPWLSQQVRPRLPRHITLRTDALRYGKQHWAQITGLLEWGKMADLDVENVSADSYRVTTKNVAALELVPPLPGRTKAGSVQIVIDGQRLDYAGGQSLAAWRQDDQWQPGHGASSTPSSTLRKVPGLEGPLRDVFLGPVTFVYGSHDERTRRANREVAEAFGRYHSGMKIEFPVIADRELDEHVAASRSLILVGTAWDHSYLARVSAKLPISATRDAVRLGGQALRGADIGAVFIHPNPEHPERYLVVITASAPSGIWRALSLPRLLPDFVVYDEDLADAATEQVLGSAEVRAAGFFGDDWSLPKNLPTRAGRP